MEHRWLHNLVDDVPNEGYTVPIGKAKIARKGKDVTIVAHSYMVLEALRCADILLKQGISIEVIDLRSIRPLDSEMILESVSKTKRLVVADNGWIHYGVSAEIISLVTENIFDQLICKPARIGMNDTPSPSTRALANHFYPRAIELVGKISEIMKLDIDLKSVLPNINTQLDIPDPSFKGPF